MRALTVLHRWFGVAFCLLFAMWFASGAVMHWVPFPELTAAERGAGLAALPATLPSPAAALAALRRDDIVRLRLTAPGGHPIFVATGTDGDLHALDPATGSAPKIGFDFALASAQAHAAARGIAGTPALLDTADTDQWTVSNGLDAHRPLFRFALNDAAGTELYVSSRTGEVVRDSTRVERIANYAGSVLHWIYPTVLRKHWAAWDATVWWLSLLALIGAVAGALIGVLRLKRGASPFSGWLYWHHLLGLGCALFVLTWIASGWLSMDHGRLFSDGRASADDFAKISGPPLRAAELDASHSPLTAQREIEWFRSGGLVLAHALTREDAERAAQRLGSGCMVAADSDAYAAQSRQPGAAVFRIACGDTWWQIDGADGRIIEKLDPSRRAYRWAFRALHTLDFPVLLEHPALRSSLIMLLCAAGFIFSLTGVVIGWRRLKRSLSGV